MCAQNYQRRKSNYIIILESRKYKNSRTVIKISRFEEGFRVTM